MIRNPLETAVFLAGLAIVGWIGAGYVGANALALCVVLLIAACYLAGAFELHRYRRATTTLDRAIEALSTPVAALPEWLDRLPPSLRHAVRLRVEGERAPLPAPALASYLVGLLVLLGMLGTLLGMMKTLQGTGLALQGATDLDAVRQSLAAPVKGLGFAFGTSIAGVAASAMLGLLSALARRERLRSAQRLDLAIATTLRVHSHSHQREEAFRLLQRQTEVMPALVDRLQSMMDAIERHDLMARERQLASQEALHATAREACSQLAASVEQSLARSVEVSTRAAGAALQPVAEATMASIARESAALHATVADALQRQMQQLSAAVESTTTSVTAIWGNALADHREANASLARDLDGTLERFGETFRQRSTALVDTVATRFEAASDAASTAWQHALSRQQADSEGLAQRNERALAAVTDRFQAHAASLVDTLDQAHTQFQATLESRDEARLAAWTARLDEMSAAHGQRWEQAASEAAARQQQICDALAHTAQEITAQTQAHARDTLVEIARLVQTASEAPKAAADVVAELRQKLSDSMARDTAMLDERNRLLATLETLLDAVNHASTDQRAAIDALVATSAELMDRIGTRFAERVDAESARLGEAAAQLGAGAVEVASLGDAFGAAVGEFGEANTALLAQLEAIGSALEKSLVRSDEQLAYYVAQAREVIDLSMLSQRQILDDMQRLAGPRGALEADAA